MLVYPALRSHTILMAVNENKTVVHKDHPISRLSCALSSGRGSSLCGEFRCLKYFHTSQNTPQEMLKYLSSCGVRVTPGGVVGKSGRRFYLRDEHGGQEGGEKKLF